MGRIVGANRDYETLEILHQNFAIFDMIVNEEIIFDGNTDDKNGQNIYYGAEGVNGLDFWHNLSWEFTPDGSWEMGDDGLPFLPNVGSLGIVE